MDEPSASRPPWSVFRDALSAAGFRPSRARGQNFLLDTNMARSIVRDSGVAPGAFVLEVGPGAGFLSAHLAQRGVELLAVEIDERLADVAERFLAPWPNVRLLHADVLAGKDRLAGVVADALPSGPWHVVSNLPFAISGPLLAVLARLAHPPRTITVLVQKEVALRVAAAPGSHAYGALTARLAVRYAARLGRRVGPELFWPRPRVESALCHLSLRPDSPGALAAYDALVGALFRHRRKGVAASLGAWLGDRARARRLLERAGIDPRARPETLDPARLLALSEGVEGGGG